MFISKLRRSSRHRFAIRCLCIVGSVAKAWRIGASVLLPPVVYALRARPVEVNYSREIENFIMLGTVLAISRLQSRIFYNSTMIKVPKFFKQYFSCRHLNFSIYQPALRIQNLYNSRYFLPNESSRYTMNIFNLNYYNYQRLSTNLKKIIDVNKKETNPLNVKTNVSNNVMLYRYERPYFFKFVTAFGVFAVLGCLTMVDNIYRVLCKDLFNPKNSWTTNIINHLLPLSFIITGLIGGPSIALTVWFITVRTVKYIILHKGGKVVTFVTYHPVKREVTRTVPLTHVTTNLGRGVSKAYVPVMIKDQKKTLVVDKNGHFVNPELFDCTIGINRNKSYTVDPTDITGYVRQL